MEGLHLKGLSTGYRGRYVAKGLDACLCPGELTCLLGSNGSGKSTLLRTIACLQPSLGGDIELGGKSLFSYSHRQLSRIIAMVLTDRVSDISMTARDVVGIGRSPYTSFFGTLDKEDRRIVDESLESVGVKFLADRQINTLSDGERQKVMIARALAQSTPIILLDEPTAFLDYPSRVDTMRLLGRLAKESGKMILMSTHDVEVALQLSSRLWVLNGGNLMTGTPNDLCLDGTLSEYLSPNKVVWDEKSSCPVIRIA